MDTLIQVYQNFVLPRLGSAQSLARRDKTISITAAIVLATFYLAYSKITKPPKNLRGLPTADNILLLKALMTGWSMRDVANKITIPAALKADHGLYVRFDQHGWIVHIQDPTAAKKFLLKADKFPKFNVHSLRVGTIPGKFFDGPNILFTNGEKWKGHRKIANPAFHRSMPVELFGRLSNKLFKVMDGMGTRINFHAMMTNFTLDAIGLAGFDFNFNAIEDPENDWVRKYHSFSKNMWNPVYLLMPWLERNFLWLLPERRKIHQDLDEFLEMLDEIIIHKRQVLAAGSTAEKDNEKDLLTLMIESENKGEGALTNEELKSNICIFFLAGHDTTANALSFAIYYLAKHPEIQEKARQEAIAVFGDEPHDILPTLEQVKSLKYINCVIKETLRINPPAGTIVARYAAEDEELNGVVIPKGAKITLDIYELHHNPRVWKNPEEYNPDRFLEGGEADQNGAMSWLPFSTGSRQCIGMNFSLAEQRVLLPLILRKYTWTLPEDSPYKDGVVTATGVIQALKSLDINFKRRY